jgi:hypothetical protein
MISLVPRRYVLFYGLRGLCVGRVDQLLVNDDDFKNLKLICQNEKKHSKGI